MHVNVKDGTEAGKKRPLAEPHGPWTCPSASCGRVNQGFVVRCLAAGCNQERPK